MDNNRLHHIDVWRCIAVSMVIFCHVIAFSHPWYRESSPELVELLRQLGTVGVQIFFCISGFVICRGMMREAATTGKVSMRGFYIRRAFRIFPPLALYILCIAALASLGVFDIPLSAFARASTFLCNAPRGTCGQQLGHTWSLAYEEQFYLVFPLLFVLLGIAVRRSRMLLCMLLLLAIYYAAPNLGVPFWRGFLEHFVYMAAGCVFAVYWKQIEPKLKQVPTAMWLAMLLLVPVVGIATLPWTVKTYLYPVAYPLLICVAVFGTPLSNRSVSAVFLNSKLAYIGRISYSIYLWQQVALVDYGFSSPLFALPMIVAVVVLSHYSFIYFEMPLIRLGAKYAGSALELKRYLEAEVPEVATKVA